VNDPLDGIRGDWLTWTKTFEGCPETRGGAYPYLDTDVPPIVTVGYGCALFTLAAFVALPWTHGPTSGWAPATDAEKAAAWGFLHTMQGGELASAYEYPGCLYLTEDGAEALADERLEADAAQLARTFPDFAAWPEPARRGALSIAWACGAGFPATWPRWSACARALDWAGCARETSIRGCVARTKATVELFEAAAGSGADHP
jgi:hypothetical protein